MQSRVSKIKKICKIIHKYLHMSQRIHNFAAEKSSYIISIIIYSHLYTQNLNYKKYAKEQTTNNSIYTC